MELVAFEVGMNVWIDAVKRGKYENRFYVMQNNGTTNNAGFKNRLEKKLSCLLFNPGVTSLKFLEAFSRSVYYKQHTRRRLH